MKASRLFVAGGVMCIAGLIAWIFLSEDFYRAKTELKKAEWSEILMKQLPVGSSMDQIQEWAKKHSFVVESASGQFKEIVLEKMNTHLDIECASWSVVAEFTMNGDHSVDERVVSMGACL